jgi:sugar transferase (PEP-CTERM/EpsH1 system associated)
MSELLFLAHRIPYPPDKGDKIRSYHLLKALAAEHTVHVGTFVDDPADWVHVEALQRLCKGETCIRPLNPTLARLRSATGLLDGQPLTLAYYRDSMLRRWVRELGTRRPLAGVFAFSACMAQYATQVALAPDAPRVLDLCDVDSDKWRQYAASHGQPLKSVYAREARTLAGVEADYARAFDATLVIAEPEARLLRERAGDDSGRIRVVGNGVDIDYFDPTREYERPFPTDARAIVFTGAMDYHANVDGVQWFAREVFPAIRGRDSKAIFIVVGSNPTSAVRALKGLQGVIVTGRVPDVRPYLAHACVVVAPLRLARGVQNKVLEALAMNRPVVATTNALQGIPAVDEAGVARASNVSDMAAAVLSLMASSEVGEKGRAFVRTNFSWSARQGDLIRQFSGCSSSAQLVAAG